MSAQHSNLIATEPVESMAKAGSARETLPLKSLDELLSFEIIASESSADALDTIYARPKGAPLVMHCHDFKGGYLEDRFDHGGQLNGDAYVFYNWHLVDLFCYFSHHLVTIPPRSWIRAAHRNGTAVLGTFITEWQSGEALCARLFGDTQLYEEAARSLARVAVSYGFDGWLVNIENRICPHLIPDVCRFLRLLTDEMHRCTPHSTVVWYDSVLSDGTLHWQNELNEHNRCFFESCDAIYLNYVWTPEKLAASKQLAVQIVGTAASQRVFVGVDVFGRNCFAGGQWNCNKAVEVINQYELSCAIFAPGWTLECHQEACFYEIENRFWSLLAKVLTGQRLCRPTVFTNFERGRGVDWYDMGRQQVQPHLGGQECAQCELTACASPVHFVCRVASGGQRADARAARSCLLIGTGSARSVVWLFETDFTLSGTLEFIVEAKLEQCCSSTAADAFALSILVSVWDESSGASMIMQLGEGSDEGNEERPVQWSVGRRRLADGVVECTCTMMAAPTGALLVKRLGVRYDCLLQVAAQPCCACAGSSALPKLELYSFQMMPRHNASQPSVD